MQKNIKLIVVSFICVIAITLQGCAVSSTNEVVKPGERKSGFMGLSKTAEVLVDNAAVLPASGSKVIIGSFKVGFLTDNKARATAKGGYFSTSSSAGHAFAAVHLKGLALADMQKVTNDIYQHFVADLQARGYTVVSAQDLANEPAYADLQNTGTVAFEEGVVLNLLPEAKATLIAPDGMKLIYFIGEKKELFNISMESIKKMQILNDKTGTPTLAVNYLVNFAGAESSGGFVSSASVKVGQGLIIGSASTTVYNGKNKAPAVVKLGQPVYSEKEFCTIHKTTSAAAKTVGTVVNVASALLGGGTSQSETFDFNADPQAYVAGVTEIGIKTNGKLLDKFAAAK